MSKKQPDVTLSLIISSVLLAFSVLFAMLLPTLLGWYLQFRAIRREIYLPLLLISYGCIAAAIVALVFLIRLLIRIRQGLLFVPENIRCLHILSLCFLMAALLSAGGGFLYFPFFAAAVGGIFMFLLLRVLRSAFLRAAEIKSENDMTI